VAHLTSADAPDATTLVLHYAQPVSNVLFQMQTLGILPQHVFGPLATGDGSQLKSFPNTPGGTPVVSGGPFMITAFTPDESLVFQRNPHYYGARPLIDGFGVQEFSSSDAMVTALQSGQLDAVVGVPPTAANTLKSSGFTVSTEPGIRNNLLFLINPNPAKPNNRELLDANVRQAFEYAIDRNSIVQTAYSGFAQVGAALVPPGAAKWHDAAITPLSFDTTKANQILDQAGFAKGSDGVRMANGHPMAYQVIIQPAFARAFQIIQTDYQQIGVQLTAQSLDRAGASAAISAPNHSYQTYDLAMTTANTEPDPDFLLSAFTSLSLTSYNIAGYHDPAFEALYQKQGTTPEAQRVAVVYQMQKMLYDARTPIVLAYPNNIDAWSKKWTGFVEYGGGLFFDDSTDSLVDAHMTS
jgi:peptide/nickel transport system substrate-binding protein